MIGYSRAGFIALAVTALLLCNPASASCPPPGYGQLAIIVDDLGYNLGMGNAIAALPAPVTLAIIPGTPHAATLARTGEARGKEIMIHMPMASNRTVVTDPITLTENLTAPAIGVLTEAAIRAVPGATGVNNHMGSLLTEDRATMTLFMARLKAHELFFIDSRTTPATVALDVARDMALPTAARSVFLDNELDRDTILEHLNEAVAIAQATGNAIAIGHPHPETLDVLTQALPALPSNVTLTPASRVARCESAQSLTSIP